MNEQSPTPWRIGNVTWEGDGVPGISVLDADGRLAAFVTTWDNMSIHRDSPTQRDRDNAALIVRAVNALANDEGKTA